MPVNRLALEDPDRVYGVLGEFEELKLDPAGYMSCGTERQGIARCPFASICSFAWQGKEGTEKVVKIDKELQIVRDENGPVIADAPAGGPKNIGVYRKDAFTGRTKVMFMPCYRYLQNKERWSAPLFGASDRRQRPPDVVVILAREGDGKMIPMRETREMIVGTDSHGRPIRNVAKVRVPRAVPFFERPKEILVERAMDLEIEALLKDQAVQQAATVVAGMPVEERPIELTQSNVIKSVNPTVPGKAPASVRQAARKAT